MLPYLLIKVRNIYATGDISQQRLDNYAKNSKGFFSTAGYKQECIYSDRKQRSIAEAGYKKVDDLFGCLFKADRPTVDIAKMDALLKQKIRN